MHVTCIAYAADMHVHTYIYAYEYVCMDKYVAIAPTPPPLCCVSLVVLKKKIKKITVPCPYPVFCFPRKYVTL